MTRISPNSGVKTLREYILTQAAADDKARRRAKTTMGRGFTILEIILNPSTQLYSGKHLPKMLSGKVGWMIERRADENEDDIEGMDSIYGKTKDSAERIAELAANFFMDQGFTLRKFHASDRQVNSLTLYSKVFFKNHGELHDRKASLELLVLRRKNGTEYATFIMGDAVTMIKVQVERSPDGYFVLVTQVSAYGPEPDPVEA